MISFELQRKNMVESQVRPSDVTDRRVIAAMLAIPREAFAPSESRVLAYMDQDLPVGGQGPSRRALLAPRTLARMVQLLEIEAVDRVLEVGSATGYGAAVLGRIAREVVALECEEMLAGRARIALAGEAVAATNVKVATGPLPAGWMAEAPYAAILVSGAVPEIPAGLLDQLQDGGRLVAVRLDGGIGRLVQWRRIGTSFAARVTGEAAAPLLPGFARVPGFVF